MRKPGKLVRNNLYIHRDYIDCYDIPESLYITRFDRMNGKDMPGVDVLKYDTILNIVSVISCFDFDGEDEPVIQMVWTDLRQINYTRDSGPIYHHKWMMVGDDYKGFDVEASKKRTERIKKYLAQVPGKKNKIGNGHYWRNFVEPWL